MTPKFKLGDTVYVTGGYWQRHIGIIRQIVQTTGFGVEYGIKPFDAPGVSEFQVSEDVLSYRPPTIKKTVKVRVGVDIETGMILGFRPMSDSLGPAGAGVAIVELTGEYEV